jgi:hypothetical protein
MRPVNAVDDILHECQAEVLGGAWEVRLCKQCLLAAPWVLNMQPAGMPQGHFCSCVDTVFAFVV